MILTQADGTKREISSDELREMLRDAKRKVTPATTIEPFDVPAFAAKVGPLGTMTLPPLPVDRRAASVRKLYNLHRYGRPLGLRFWMISVSVSALAGFIMAGL